MTQPVVVYVINAFNRGGAESGLLTLVEGGAFAGCRLHVIALVRGAGDVGDALSQGGTEVTVLDDRVDMTSLSWVLAVPRLWRILRELRPDALILSLPQANIAGRLAGRLAGVAPIASFEHNTHLARPLYERLFRWTSRLVDWVIADCPATSREAIRRLYLRTPERVVTLPLLRLIDDPSRGAARPDGPLRVVSAGRFTTVKNQAAMVDAAAELRRRGLDLRWTLFGDGPCRPALQRRLAELGLEDLVALPGHDPGWADHPADLFVLASRHEGLCIVALEAMARGVPVVSPCVGGLQDYGQEAEVCFLDAAEGPALADAVETLAADPERRRRMGNAGRRVAFSRFGEAAVDRQYAQFSAMLRALTGRPSADRTPLSRTDASRPRPSPDPGRDTGDAGRRPAAARPGPATAPPDAGSPA